MADLHKNFGYSKVKTAPSPSDTGTSLIVTSGNGELFPAPPFNIVIYPPNVQPLASNAEIARVINVVGDTFTISRAQEDTTAISILGGYQVSAAVTNKMFTDLEYPVSNTKTSAYDMTIYDDTIICNGTFDVSLPSADLCLNKVWNIYNTGSGTITIKTVGGETISGFSSGTMMPMGNLQIKSIGTNFIIL